MSPGIPLGSGGGITKALSKLYNYTCAIQLYTHPGTYNITTRKWGGLIGDVSDSCASLFY